MALQDYYKNRNATETRGVSFVSYLETVMAEPGYDDLPYAILDEGFGAILNVDGEVEFGEYLLKVTQYGLLVSKKEKKDELRKLSSDINLLSYCNGSVILSDINPDRSLSRIDNHEGVYFFDTFHMLKEEEHKNVASSNLPTRSMASNLNECRETSASLYLRDNWENDFTRPGDQKVMFSNSKYCNDTKIYQQHYLVLSASGIKVKTMKKRAFGVWNKFSNPIEGGIKYIAILETAAFESINGNTEDIDKVAYEGTRRIVYTVNARGASVAGIMGFNLQDYINAGNALAKEKGISNNIEGVRFVMNDKEALTRFPDVIESKTDAKIELKWPVPFGGFTTTPASYLLGNNSIRNRGMFHVLLLVTYGQSTMGQETRGSKMIYTY